MNIGGRYARIHSAYEVVLSQVGAFFCHVLVRLQALHILYLLLYHNKI